MRCIQDLGAVVALQVISCGSEYHAMTVGHADGDLGEVAKRGHAVHALWHLDRLLQLEGELVVDEDASVAAADEKTINCYNGAIHLTSLDVELLDDHGGVGAVDIHVVALVVHQKEGLADRLNVLNFVAFDTVDERGSFVLSVQVLEGPDLTEIFLAHYLVGILGGFLNTIQHLDVLKVETWCASGRQKWT